MDKNPKNSNSLGKRIVSFPDGTSVPVLGQGTWNMGEKQGMKEQEVKALRLGFDLGMTLIDTAEMYASGGAELVVGEAIEGLRDQVFLVSKVYPHNAGRNKVVEACENSLRRLKTDYLDLYLLHWKGQIPLEETVEGMEKLKKMVKFCVGVYPILIKMIWMSYLRSQMVPTA